MLQHELKIYRHWECSICGRSVRTRGAVASRLCECATPATFMKLIDTPPVGAFDASAFTTYDNEVDATPTERELVEELPEHMLPPPVDTENIKPTFRRGTGYLRAEMAPEAEVEAEHESLPLEPVVVDFFGAGLDSGAEPPAVAETSDSGGTGKKRRRRRRRKPRETDDATVEAAASVEAETNGGHQTSVGSDAEPVAQQTSTQVSAASESSPSASDSPDGVSPQAENSDEGVAGESGESADGAPKKKRRRRRRKGK